MEELGVQLSSAKLAAVELREAADNAQQQSQQDGAATWANDRLVTQCKGCSREFNIARRKVIKLFNYSAHRDCEYVLIRRQTEISARRIRSSSLIIRR